MLTISNGFIEGPTGPFTSPSGQPAPEFVWTNLAKSQT